MRFFSLNVKHRRFPDRADGPRDSHARYWLDERQRAPIFFGQSTIEDIVGSSASSAGLGGDAFDFCELGLDRSRWANTIIATVDEGSVWLYRPAGWVEEAAESRYPGELPKSFPIKLLQCVPVSDVPLVLASMKSNPHFSRGTFKEINYGRHSVYAANALAIVAVVGQPAAHLLPAELRRLRKIDCLSSLELETLIAKLFERLGCFVPAYKGGFMAGIDLIVHNDSRRCVRLGALEVPGRQRRSVQVKLRVDAAPITARGSADFLITRESGVEEDGCFGREWLVEQLAALPARDPVRLWLDRASRWAKPLVESRDFG